MPRRGRRRYPAPRPRGRSGRLGGARPAGSGGRRPGPSGCCVGAAPRFLSPREREFAGRGSSRGHGPPREGLVPVGQDGAIPSVELRSAGLWGSSSSHRCPGVYGELKFIGTRFFFFFFFLSLPLAARRQMVQKFTCSDGERCLF